MSLMLLVEAVDVFPFNYIKLLFLILVGMDIIWHLIACLLYMLMLYLTKSAPNIFILLNLL